MLACRNDVCTSRPDTLRWAPEHKTQALLIEMMTRADETSNAAATRLAAVAPGSPERERCSASGGGGGGER